MPSADSTDPTGSSATCSLAFVDGTTSTTPINAANAERAREQEDRAPVELFEQPAGHEQAERASRAGEAGPDPDRLGALLGWEHAGDGGERARHHQRGADAHHGTEHDQRARVLRGRAERGRAAEQHQPDDQGEPASVPVAERPGREQQRGERQRVGVDDPLLLGLARAEALGQVGHAVGEHRHAGDDHHERQAHHRQDQRCGCGSRRGPAPARPTATR